MKPAKPALVILGLGILASLLSGPEAGARSSGCGPACEDMDARLKAYQRLAEAEGSNRDADSDFRVIEASVGKVLIGLKAPSDLPPTEQSPAPQGLGIGEATDLFLAILHVEGGSCWSSEAQEVYNLVIANGQRYDIWEQFASYRKIRYAEDTTDHRNSVIDYRLALRAADLCGSLPQAADHFVAVLNETGATNSSDAQSFYRRFYRF